jgi:hypothetical protein
MPASLVRLKVTLDHVEPMVMRRVVVPARIKLSPLHGFMRCCRRRWGRTDSQLYELRIRDVGFALPDQDWGDGPSDARKTQDRKISVLAAIEDTGANSATAGCAHSLAPETEIDYSPIW